MIYGNLDLKLEKASSNYKKNNLTENLSSARLFRYI